MDVTEWKVVIAEKARVSLCERLGESKSMISAGAGFWYYILSYFCTFSLSFHKNLTLSFDGKTQGLNVDYKKYSDQLSTTALVRRNATKNLENSCLILNQLY